VDQSADELSPTDARSDPEGGQARSCGECGTSLPRGAKFCRRCGAELEAPSQRIVDLLARGLGSGFRIVGELGQGGFAIVYRVDETDGERRRLAVKVMRRELMISPLLVERFRREIRLVSRLHHPNILSVAFSGEHGNLVYYAMQLVRGGTLKDLLRRNGQLPVDRALRIMRGIAEGLACAHEQGIIHRDVKPSNIMLDEHGTALLLDFGVARALTPHGGTLTVSGEIIGSPQYMSPEQAVGSRKLDPGTDIYSWGLVSYEMLAGTPAFKADSTQEIMRKHLNESPVPIGEVRTDVPASVSIGLMRALARSPSERWTSFREILPVLED
jgi:eukaryotic-like serine/threonine-protein kinase